ncbi:MAG: DUF2442 domain-containing protein [Acidobacteria bacterium]|nr:DUF2442 domain-containing protein [Acidobacteriota bacterium]
MSSPGPELRPLARRVELTDEELRVDLADGRRIIVPLAWFPRLMAADAAARSNWQLLGDGEGIHWSAADEDLSVAGLLAGSRGAGTKAA